VPAAGSPREDVTVTVLLIVIGCWVVLWLVLAALHAGMRGLTFRQSFFHLPVKLAYRVRDGSSANIRGEPPVIYAILHQSRLDPALMLALLPSDTLHILDEASAKSAWLEPWRAMARTIAFNARHVFVSRRLVRVLKGNGRLAVYFPDGVQPDSKGFRLYRAVARIALKAEARIIAISVRGSRNTSLSLVDAPRKMLPRLAVNILPALTMTELVSLSGQPASSTALWSRVLEADAA